MEPRLLAAFIAIVSLLAPTPKSKMATHMRCRANTVISKLLRCSKIRAPCASKRWQRCVSSHTDSGSLTGMCTVIEQLTVYIIRPCTAGDNNRRYPTRLRDAASWYRAGSRTSGLGGGGGGGGGGEGGGGGREGGGGGGGGGGGEKRGGPKLTWRHVMYVISTTSDSRHINGETG